MSCDQHLDLQAFRNQLCERKKKKPVRVRVEKVRSKHLWSTFHSFIPLILLFPQSVLGPTGIFPWRHSRIGYLNLSRCDTRKRTDALLFFFLASILPLSQVGAQIAHFRLRTEERHASMQSSDLNKGRRCPQSCTAILHSFSFVLKAASFSCL